MNVWGKTKKQSQIADDIDFQIFGEELQCVEIELDPQESIICEAGVMMMKDTAITMDTIGGRGIGDEDSILDDIKGIGSRLLTGESFLFTKFTNEGVQKAKISMAASFPGKIIPINLAETDGEIICQKNSFLCAAKGVGVSVFLQKKILTAIFGGEGFIMQHLKGDGWAFLHFGGTVVEKILGPGEQIHVDTGSVAAFTSTVTMDIETVGDAFTMIGGGEGMFFSRLTGPGTVLIQSLPFSRLVAQFVPPESKLKTLLGLGKAASKTFDK
jgi:uncharacterized protein (AIM24 family)